MFSWLPGCRAGAEDVGRATPALGLVQRGLALLGPEVVQHLNMVLVVPDLNGLAVPLVQPVPGLLNLVPKLLYYLISSPLIFPPHPPLTPHLLTWPPSSWR